MLPLMLTLALSTLLTQTPSANTACAALTPAQVTSLIGAARTMPLTSAANGSTCMFQNGDRVLTVLTATVSSADAAKGLFNSKKAVAAGTDIAGWGVPAYYGTGKDYAACGIMKQQTLTELKIIDKTQTSAVMVQKLQTVMKEFAARK